MRAFVAVLVVVALQGCGMFCDHKADGRRIAEGARLLRKELGPTTAAVSSAIDALEGLGGALAK